MDAYRVAETSEGTGSGRVDGEYQISSVGYTLHVNKHRVNAVTKLGKAYLGISRYCHYLQCVIGSKMYLRMSSNERYTVTYRKVQPGV